MVMALAHHMFNHILIKLVELREREVRNSVFQVVNYSAQFGMDNVLEDGPDVLLEVTKSLHSVWPIIA
jgi:hypothetical protein